MKNTNFNKSDETNGESEPESIDLEITQVAADAIAEIIVEADMQVETDEAISIANEILEKFTSPLMKQRAAGATSQVSIMESPLGGVESGRSVKAQNIFYNFKATAFALPTTLPTLLTVFGKNQSSESIRLAMAAVFATFGLLKLLSTAVKIPLTTRTAGVLRAMWVSAKDNADVVSHDGLLEKVNSEFERYKWQPIDAEELLTHLESLEKIGCIEKDEAYNSILIENMHWHLKERVKLIN